KLLQEIWSNVNIRAHSELQIDLLDSQCALEIRDPSPNTTRIIVVKTRHDVRGTRHYLDPVCNSHPRHRNGRLQVLSAVVTPWKEVRMKIYHALSLVLLQLATA